MAPKEDPSHLGVRAYAILLALSEQERHGYDIMRQVAADSDGSLSMGPATLYTTLKRLLDLGLVSEAGTQTEEAPHAAQRRYYRLSAAGVTSLREELARTEKFTTLLRRRLA